MSKEEKHNMAACMLSILDSLKLYDNGSLELGDETLSEMMFRKMKGYNIDLNKELGFTHLKPVTKPKQKKMSKVIVPNLKFDSNEFELEGEIVDNIKQKCLDGSIFEYYLVKTKYGINKYIKEEIKPKQR
jgi:hypothetical protein